MSTTTEREREPLAPRTYRSGWVHDRLMTAEEWLREEAHVIRGLREGDDEPDAGPDDAGTMDAIAAEIETLRRDSLLWSEQATRQATALEEAHTVIRVAASLMDEVEAVHKLTGGGFRDRLRVEMVRVAAERGTRHAPAATPAPQGATQEGEGC